MFSISFHQHKTCRNFDFRHPNRNKHTYMMINPLHVLYASSYREEIGGKRCTSWKILCWEWSVDYVQGKKNIHRGCHHYCRVQKRKLRVICYSQLERSLMLSCTWWFDALCMINACLKDTAKVSRSEYDLPFFFQLSISRILIILQVLSSISKIF